MPALSTYKLRKEFGAVVAVNDVTLSVEPGSVVGLIGPNGAGKTTLLRLLATLLPPTDGLACLLGFDLRRDYLAVRRRIGYLPDFFNLHQDLTLRECLLFFARAYGIPEALAPVRIREALAFVDLAGQGDDLVRHLSRGMVQRFGLATLLVRDPEILLLDEPASGLDPRARVQLRAVLRRLGGEGRTVIISSHILPELADFCTHIALMDRGRLVVCGAVDEVRRATVPARRLAVTVLGDPQSAAGCIARQGGFRVVRVDGNTLQVETGAGLDALADLNAALVAAGCRVVRFAEQEASIEDIFMQVTAPNAGEAVHAPR